MHAGTCFTLWRIHLVLGEHTVCFNGPADVLAACMVSAAAATPHRSAVCSSTCPACSCRRATHTGTACRCSPATALCWTWLDQRAWPVTRSAAAPKIRTQYREQGCTAACRHAFSCEVTNLLLHVLLAAVAHTAARSPCASHTADTLSRGCM